MYLPSNTNMMVSSSLQRWLVCVVIVVALLTESSTHHHVCSGAAVDPPLAAPNVVAMNYSHQGEALQGFVATPTEGDGPFPAVIIIPDWDGVNFYEQVRATLMATEHNWVGFAADIYGASLHNVTDMDQRIELATLYRSNATLFAHRIQAAVDLVKTLDQVDPDNIAILGFCFGGTGVLLYALEDIPDGVETIVSMHGGLTAIVGDASNVSNFTTKANILVLSGGEDDASTDIISLEMALDSAIESHGNETSNETSVTHGSWEITRFDGIEHAWTVWMNDAYDKWADMRTWQRATQFLMEAFGEITYASIEPADDEIATKIVAVPYVDPTDGTALQGYMALPNRSKWVYPAPAVIVLPDWDGVNDYEKKRAILFAEEGYIGFAADIYGSDLQVIDDIDKRVELVTKYLSDIPLYMSRITAALATIYNGTTIPSFPIALVGYCFGGTGVVQYAFNGAGEEEANDAFRVGVAYHGGLDTLPNATKNISMYMLIESGGEDAAHGNQTVLEQALNDANAEWEISRYSGVVHGFTVWSDDVDGSNTTESQSAEHSNHRSMQGSSPYSVIADARSWQATMEILNARMPSTTVSGAPTSTDIGAPTSSPGSNSNKTSAAFVANARMIVWLGMTLIAVASMQF